MNDFVCSYQPIKFIEALLISSLFNYLDASVLLKAQMQSRNDYEFLCFAIPKAEHRNTVRMEDSIQGLVLPPQVL